MLFNYSDNAMAELLAVQLRNSVAMDREELMSVCGHAFRRAYIN